MRILLGIEGHLSGEGICCPDVWHTLCFSLAPGDQERIRVRTAPEIC